MVDSYERLRGEELLIDGELRPSIDTIRRLAHTQTYLATSLGLTPTTFRELTHEKLTVDLSQFRTADETIEPEPNKTE